jgi:hypothetical protein
MLFNQTAVDGLPVVHAIKTSDALLARCLYAILFLTMAHRNDVPLGSGTVLEASLHSNAGTCVDEIVRSLKVLS